jgi:hypothetical protein
MPYRVSGYGEAFRDLTPEPETLDCSRARVRSTAMARTLAFE